MPTQANKPKSNFEPIKAGTYIARCYRFIHLGTTEGTYQGLPVIQNKIMLSFEFPNDKKVFKEGDDAKPMTVSQEYTLSMGDKSNLKRLVEGIIGTTLNEEEAYNFDVETLVGMPCILTIKNKTSAKGNVRAEIASASPLMKGMSAPDAINKPAILSFSNWNQELFDSLPVFLRDKIESSEQWKNKHSTLNAEEIERLNQIQAQNTHDRIDVDNIPF